MKKKTLIITASVLTLLFGIGMFTSGFLKKSSGKLSGKVNLTDADKITASCENILCEDLKNNVNSGNEVIEPEKFSSDILNIDAKQLSYEEYIDVESYLNFIVKHKLTPQELNVIDKLIADGTTVNTIEEIYKFYLTTNEDFSIIEEIAVLEDEIWGKNWIENAFNKITGNKHGVITAGEASQYLEDFETGEILYANILSRKGVYTIQEILEMNENEKTWSEITEEIYSSVISDEMCEGSKEERNEIFVFMNSDTLLYDEAPYEIYEFADLCARYKINIDDAVIGFENVYEAKRKVVDEINDNYIPAVNKLKESYGLPEEYMTKEEYTEYYDEYYSKAIESGISEREIEVLEAKGYSMREIAETGEMIDGDIALAVKTVKAQREAEIK